MLISPLTNRTHAQHQCPPPAPRHTHTTHATAQPHTSRSPTGLSPTHTHTQTQQAPLTSMSPVHTPCRVAASGLPIVSLRMGSMRCSTRSPILRTSSPRQRAAPARRSSPVGGGCVLGVFWRGGDRGTQPTRQGQKVSVRHEVRHAGAAWEKPPEVVGECSLAELSGAPKFTLSPPLHNPAPFLGAAHRHTAHST